MIRLLTLVGTVAALALSEPVATLAQHVPAPHLAPPPAFHAPPPAFHAPPPLPFHPPSLPTQAAPPIRNAPAPLDRISPVVPYHIDVHPPSLPLPGKHAVAPPTLIAKPLAIPNQYALRRWQWNPIVILQPPLPLCSGGSYWGQWGLLATPTFGSTFSDQPFEIYSAYQFGAGSLGGTWPFAYPQAPCGSSNFF